MAIILKKLHKFFNLTDFSEDNWHKLLDGQKYLTTNFTESTKAHFTLLTLCLLGEVNWTPSILNLNFQHNDVLLMG